MVLFCVWEYLQYTRGREADKKYEARISRILFSPSALFRQAVEVAVISTRWEHDELRKGGAECTQLKYIFKAITTIVKCFQRIWRR
jgi:hypothetical protein